MYICVKSRNSESFLEMWMRGRCEWVLKSGVIGAIRGGCILHGASEGIGVVVRCEASPDAAAVVLRECAAGGGGWRVEKVRPRSQALEAHGEGVRGGGFARQRRVFTKQLWCIDGLCGDGKDCRCDGSGDPVGVACGEDIGLCTEVIDGEIVSIGARMNDHSREM